MLCKKIVCANANVDLLARPSRRHYIPLLLALLAWRVLFYHTFILLIFFYSCIFEVRKLTHCEKTHTTHTHAFSHLSHFDFRAPYFTILLFFFSIFIKRAKKKIKL